MPIYESSESDDEATPRVKLFGRERPIHSILGGGKGCAIFPSTFPSSVGLALATMLGIAGRDKKVSAALLIAVTAIWFLFEVAEYNFVTLLCHISVTAMLVIFIWCMSADYLGWNRPKIPELLSNEHAFKEVVSNFHWRFNQFLLKFLHIAGGNDPVQFFLVIISLYIISVIGSCFDFVNLLFTGFVCMETLPFLYTQYESEVDYHAGQMTRKVSKMYRRFDSGVLDKIPRGPVKEKKHK